MYNKYITLLWKVIKNMNQSDLITLITQWQQTDPTIYKSNIKALCHLKGIKPRHLESTLNISYSMAKSIVNPSHKARIEFLMALILAEYLQCDVKDFLKNI